MSRIDQALERARNARPEDVLTNVQPPADDSAFPSELPLETTAAEPEFSDAEAGEDTTRPGSRATTAAPKDFDQFVGDDAYRSQDDLRELPFAEKLAGGSDSSSTEQYRRLAGRLYLAQAEAGTRVVMVTSAMPGEGKTLTATNLALTLAGSYKREVLLIDADLRRPSIHEMFRLPNITGLNDGIGATEDRKVPLLRVSEHLTVLTAGRPDRDPMSVLASERMKRVIKEASLRFDWVIIDTPPVALLTDAHLLAALVDSVILVVQAGRTPLRAINTAVQAVGRDRIMGIVLNRAQDALPYQSYSYYAYTSDQAPAEGKD